MRLDELAQHLWAVMKGTSWDPRGPMGMEAQFVFEPGRTGSTIIVIERLRRFDDRFFQLGEKGHRTWRAKTPDLDNLWKLCLEAAQHGGVVEDDKQFVKAAVSKIDRAG